MSDSDSQNVLGVDYDDAVEEVSEETTIEESSPEVVEVVQRPSKTSDRKSSSTSESSSSSSGSSDSDSSGITSTSGRESSTERARETSTRTIGVDHGASAPSRDREATPDPGDEEPTTSTAAEPEFVFLNSESVDQQECLLTTHEAVKISARLSGRVKFDTQMGPKRGFSSASAPRAPRAKMTLGKKANVAETSAGQEVCDAAIPAAQALGGSTTVTTDAATDSLAPRVPGRKGKEKASGKDAEQTGALKRRRKQSPPSGVGAGVNLSLLTRLNNL
ncbi:PREDICTED: suppressor protein SRP40-like [Ipomoea nil]|uniref:suppressor protein SRP40-like n=1 Tax=Ipomoea nil TaxID=35883 RepID=UPI000901FFD3|nr:PREDICTED: suppressor protein SRP40-like [Ipomoea nil]